MVFQQPHETNTRFAYGRFATGTQTIIANIKRWCYDALGSYRRKPLKRLNALGIPCLVIAVAGTLFTAGVKPDVSLWGIFLYIAVGAVLAVFNWLAWNNSSASPLISFLMILYWGVAAFASATALPLIFLLENWGVKVAQSMLAAVTFIFTIASVAVLFGTPDSENIKNKLI